MPRDYQNEPPAATHPPQTKSETPAAHGMGQAAPEPTSGVEGTAGPYENMDPPAEGTGAPMTTMEDTKPVTTTATTTT